MAPIRSLASKFAALFRRRELVQRVDEELQFHLRMQVEEDARRGFDPRDARRKLGNLTHVSEEVYRMNTIAFLEETARNVRFSMRILRKNPGFAAAAIITLAIGIGANTAVFSVVDGVLLKPLAYPEPERLVSISHFAPGFGGIVDQTGLRLSTGMYFTYLRENHSFENMGVWNSSMVAVSGASEPEQVLAIGVSAGTLEALSVPPMLGHWFSAQEQKPGAPQTVLLTHSYWQQRFGGDPAVIGRTLSVDSRPRQVIGVMPKEFRMADLPASIITPMQLDEARAEAAGFNLESIGRLKPGISLDQASADMARMIPIWIHFRNAAPIAVQVFSSWRVSPHLRPLRETIVGNVGQVLWLVMGTLGAVMLIACANVVNLLLVHIEGRHQELSVRAALGAGRARLLHELLTESGVLVSVGALLGLGFASAGVRLLERIAPANLPRLTEIAVDRRAAGFALAVAAISTLLLGLAAAWRQGGRLSLRGGGRTSSAGPERQRARDILVVAQVSLALVLLISSGLMIRTFQNMRTAELGFTGAAQIQTVRLVVPPALVQDTERVTRMQQDIRDRLAAVPGVTDVGFSSAVPLEGAQPNWDGIFAEGQTISPDAYPPARMFRNVAPGFFKAMGTRVIAGRDYAWDDLYGGSKRVLVSENLAREFWGSPAAAIGKRVSTRPESPRFEVIGVVEDVRISGPNQPAPAVVYWPSYYTLPFLAQDVRIAIRSAVFVIRSPRAGTQSLAEDIRKAIWSVNGNLALANMLTMEQIAGRSRGRTSFALVMLAIAGGMALLLGIVGIYGVLAYAVAQRRKEVGIRLALGAEPAAVQRMFLRQGLFLSLTGCALGIGGAVVLSRLMRFLLFGVTPLDPMTYVVMPVVLLLAALAACYLPARRAAAVDPMEALSAE